MTPALSATKKSLIQAIRSHRKEIDDWYCRHANQAAPPFYCSIDLRDSGHKIVPVDSNLYPAGFNNICQDDLRSAPPIIKNEIDRRLAALGRMQVKRVLLLPESHTQNKWYAENLYYLRQILIDAGYEVQIGWYGPIPAGMSAPIKLVSVTEKILEAWPIEITANIVSSGGFVPDCILLNNDFSSGYPRELDGLTQPVLPSHVLGWHSRKKSEHFKHYNALAGEFAALIGIDPWHIQVDTQEVGPVNFNEEQGIEEVAQSVDRLLVRAREQYAIHKVKGEPFAFVKNNAGTYGMGIMVVHSAEELRQMNRRTKNKMSVGKNRLPIESVVIQEGVPTTTLVDRLPAEPVIYLAGQQLIGGFLRTNTSKGVEENLNSEGMVFRKLCMSDLRASLEDDEVQEPTLELVYGTIAKISALAAGMELTEHHGNISFNPCLSDLKAAALAR